MSWRSGVPHESNLFQSECAAKFPRNSMANAAMLHLAHLIGPGGAGKTSTGQMLAKRLGWTFVDLDHQFIAREGDIAEVIQRAGYREYARRNVVLYESLMADMSTPTVLALSSGFMSYAGDVTASYAARLSFIERNPLTTLLLPSFDTEECVQIIIERQMNRAYLKADRAKEERKIRERFPVLKALACARFESKHAIDEVAAQIFDFLSREIQNR